MSDSAPADEQRAGAGPGSPTHLAWSLFKNTFAQGGGRVFLLIAKLAIASLIIRTCGAERYGEYSLILGILLLCEWIADFGIGDIVVREICHEPESEQSLLQILAGAKLFQVLVAYLLLALLLLGMGYPSHVLVAGLIGGIELLFFAGITIYKALFKARLTMERDALAEAGGVVVLLGLLWLACNSDTSLTVLVSCFVASRFVHLALIWRMGRRQFPLAISTQKDEQRRIFRATVPIGVAGILVGLYDQLEPLMLFQMEGSLAVGLYSGVQRFFLAGLTVLATVGLTMYPILSSAWRQQRAEFGFYLQTATDVVMVLAGFMFCMLQIGAGFVLELLSPEMLEAAPALRVLAWVLFLRGITTMVGPVLVVVGAQSQILWIAVLAVVAKAGLLLVLIPSHGYLGAAYGYLAAEAIAGFLPTILAAQRFTGIRLRWGVLVRLGFVALVTIGLPSWLGWRDDLWGILLAGALYPPAVLAVGALRLSQLKSFAGGVRARFDS